jgi:hypothetical protein
MKAIVIEETWNRRVKQVTPTLHLSIHPVRIWISPVMTEVHSTAGGVVSCQVDVLVGKWGRGADARAFY